MNPREHNQKFQQQSNIKNSELDRLNVNSTQDTSHLSQGNIVFPTNLDNHKKQITQTTNILLKITCIVISVLLFIFIPARLESIIPYDFYDSLTFLFLSIVICSLMGIIFFYFFKYLLTNKKRS